MSIFDPSPDSVRDLLLFGYVVNFALNVVGFVAAVLLVRQLASKRWLALLGLNGLVLARRLFEITVGVGILPEQYLFNVFLIPFLHATLLDIATIGTYVAIRRGRRSVFALRPACELRYAALIRAAKAIERRLPNVPGASGG